MKIKIKKEKIGKVIKNKCNKSITVIVTKMIKHFIYGKFIKKSKKFIVHDEYNKCKIGDIVKITETRPISKKKRWKIKKIIKNK